MKILGVIPARGGSKGILRKNLKIFAEKPLLIWSIEAAINSKLLDRFLVSTEDDEISDVAKKAGAEVLLRPPELATDFATTVSVLQHVIECHPADIIVLLQPTSPIRCNQLIDQATTLFIESDCDTLATGYLSHHYEWGKFNNLPRQKLKGYFHDDGNIYIFDSKVIKAGKWTGDRLYKMEVDAIHSIEIDTMADFWANEGILHGLKKGE